MSLINRLYIKYTTIYKGSDRLGNMYYESKNSNIYDKKCRYVIYTDNDNEPSKVPPLWHGWLHHLTDDFPANKELQYSWQMEHNKNMTGTNLAYSPIDRSIARKNSDFS